MSSPLRDRRNEPQEEQDIKRDITSLHWIHTLLFLSPIGELLLSDVIGIQTMVKIESFVKQARKIYRDQFLEFSSSPNCPQTNLLAYERVKRRNLQEDNGIFKHEPKSNVYYNQYMEM